MIVIFRFKESSQLVDLEEKHSVLNRLAVPASDIDRIRRDIEADETQLCDLKIEAGNNWKEGLQSTELKSDLTECQVWEPVVVIM